MANKLPTFSGKPLIELPATIPTANFLEGDFGKAVNAEVQGKYGKFPAISVVKYNKETGLVEGSTPFYDVAVQEVIGQEGLRVANQADLERALKANALPLRGQYEDTGLVLRTNGDPNEYLAKDLMAQIKARNPKAKMPAMIPLSELELVADGNSPHNLRFNLKENANVFYDLSVLNKGGSFSSEDIDLSTGLPKKTGKGDRTLYTISSGLSRLFLYWGLDASSDYGGLAVSDGCGRVVVVSAEGTSQNVERYIAQLQQEKDKQMAEVEARFNQARKVMLDK